MSLIPLYLNLAFQNTQQCNQKVLKAEQIDIEVSDMTENYEHYITRNIKAFYHRRIFSPILYIIILTVLWFIFPLSELLSPPELSTTDTLKESYDQGVRFATANLENLTFTGYTSKRFGNTNGYYYYTEWNGECIIVLLSSVTSEEGNPLITSVTARGHIQKANNSYHALLAELATDLNWTDTGITAQMPDYYFSEPDYNPRVTFILFLLYFGTGIYAFACLVVYWIYSHFPLLSPPCQNLIVFGNPRNLIHQAEEELATLPQLATEDMFITEHFFILTSPLGNAVVPIDEILWIYKHSTLHKILWYHFSISYTMHIVANKHMYIHCPKNTKSDIDGIMDYLAEANHSICVGFSEENRLRVESVLGKPFNIEKFYAFMRRKI